VVAAVWVAVAVAVWVAVAVAASDGGFRSELPDTG
ncbi:unnamed protein product, partial [marine sediment metagenome]